ncbi:hypothetical protein DFH27DRAFT_537131 [Peziza echinospora]|nr:hypothetical protein DFH27DRAFT_537131 [Peziza echinospora]
MRPIKVHFYVFPFCVFCFFLTFFLLAIRVDDTMLFVFFHFSFLYLLYILEYLYLTLLLLLY